MRYHIILFLFIISNYNVFAEGKSAAEIVKLSEEKMRGKTLQGQMIIKTIRPTYTREMSVKVWMKGNDFSLIQVLSPAKEKGITFLKRKKEVWNWIPSIERSIKLPPSMMSQSWMGTDFTNDDLVKESSILDDYNQDIAGSEKTGERDCWKILLSPKPDAAVVWGKIFIWIDKTDFMQLKSEFYDEDGALINIMTGAEIKEMDGRMIPTVIEMTTSAKPGNKTAIIYKILKFDQPIGDDFFSTQNMKSVK